MNHMVFRSLGLEFFNLTPEHCRLLRRMSIGWNPRLAGAPAVNCYRPYGNSAVHSDLAEILEIPLPDWEAGETFSPEQITRMETLHRETELALQVVLQAGRFQPGVYARRWFSDWTLVVAREEKTNAK